jgi:hypothetical protein
VGVKGQKLFLARSPRMREVHSSTPSRPSSSINARDSAKEFITLTGRVSQVLVPAVKASFQFGNRNLRRRFRRKPAICDSGPVRDVDLLHLMHLRNSAGVRP